MSYSAEILRRFVQAWLANRKNASAAARECGYNASMGASWIGGLRLLRAAKQHPDFQRWIAELAAPAQPRTSGPYFSPDVQIGPGILATPLLKDRESWRREELARKLAVPVEEISPLPESELRWDMRGDRLAPFRLDDEGKRFVAQPKSLAASYANDDETYFRRKRRREEALKPGGKWKLVR